jgi:DNA repair protein RadD
MILRTYQDAVIARYETAVINGIKRIIIVAPTGSGKTVIIAEIVKRAVAASKRVVFLAHRDELLTQASDKLKAFGVVAGIIKSGRDRDQRPQALVQICGIQTLHARAIRAQSMELPPAEIVIIDEAHHCRAMTYQAILEAYPNAIVIGLTATPCRGDGRGLGNVFETMIEAPQISELIKMNPPCLVPVRIFAPAPPDLRGVPVATTGDYVLGQLESRMDTDQLVGDFVEHWKKYAQDRRTIVFAVGVAHSVHLRDELIKEGIRAEHIDGKTPQDEREAIIARFTSGETAVICNVGVFTEGFDSPDVGCIALVRPTRSLGLFRQMIGRGLRPAEGKSDVIILDHAGGVSRHGRPDDDITWTLDTDRRAANPIHEARKATAGSDPFCECKGCGQLRMRGLACTACGWGPKPHGKAVEYVDGELIELGKQKKAPGPSEADRRIFYAELRGWSHGRRKRDGTPYSSGWAWHQYQNKFHSPPPTAWSNDARREPSLATQRWIKSRFIAFAKRRAAS